jgi:hypothetical protein
MLQCLGLLGKRSPALLNERIDILRYLLIESSPSNEGEAKVQDENEKQAIRDALLGLISAFTVPHASATVASDVLQILTIAISQVNLSRCCSYVE